MTSTLIRPRHRIRRQPVQHAADKQMRDILDVECRVGGIDTVRDAAVLRQQVQLAIVEYADAVQASRITDTA